MPHVPSPQPFPAVSRLPAKTPGTAIEVGLIHWTTGEARARISARARDLLGNPGPDAQVDLVALWLGIDPADQAALVAAAQAIRPGHPPITLAVRTGAPAGADGAAGQLPVEVSFQAIASAQPAGWDTYALIRPLADARDDEAAAAPWGASAAGRSEGQSVPSDPAPQALFQPQVQQALKRIARAGGLLAVMALEIGWQEAEAMQPDGGQAGILHDLLAARIGQALRAGDLAVPALAGEAARAPGSVRFSVLLPRIDAPQDAVRVASRLQALVCEPLEHSGGRLEPILRTGIALHPWDGQDADSLIDCAASALAAARQADDGAPRFFSKPINALSADRLGLELALKAAIAAQTFVLRFQPRMDGESRALIGIEALIRWQHPDRGMIAPRGFLEVAEQSRLIVPIGAWVLEQACGQHQRWQAAGLPAVPVSVNVSVVQFRDPAFVAAVERALSLSGLAPALLELEITESVAMRDVPEAIRILRALKALGVRISIDDFGTGFSSLAYLQDFPVDALKIDRTFIQAVTRNTRSASIACAVIDMAGRLGIDVVAEGVETEAQRRFLRDNGVREMQGFLFARPLSADGLEGFWRNCLGGSAVDLAIPASLLSAARMVQ